MAAAAILMGRRARTGVGGWSMRMSESALWEWSNARRSGDGGGWGRGGAGSRTEVESAPGAGEMGCFSKSRSYSLLIVSIDRTVRHWIWRPLSFESRDQAAQKSSELFHLAAVEGRFERRPGALHLLRVKLAEEIDSLCAEAHEDAAPVFRRRHPLYQTARLEAVEQSGDSALGNQGSLGDFGACEARALGPCERHEHIELREGEVVVEVGAVGTIYEEEARLDQGAGRFDERFVGGLGDAGEEGDLVRGAGNFGRHDFHPLLRYSCHR